MLHLFVNDRYPKKFPSDHCVWKILLPEIYEIDFLMSRERHTRVHFVTQLFTNHKILVVLLLVTCVVTCRDFSFYLLISLKINSAYRCCIIATWTIYFYFYFFVNFWHLETRRVEYSECCQGVKEKNLSPQRVWNPWPSIRWSDAVTTELDIYWETGELGHID